MKLGTERTDRQDLVFGNNWSGWPETEPGTAGDGRWLGSIDQVQQIA